MVLLQDFNVEDLLQGVESPPLTPEETVDVAELLMDPAPTDSIRAMSCEELLNGLSDSAVIPNDCGNFAHVMHCFMILEEAL